MRRNIAMMLSVLMLFVLDQIIKIYIFKFRMNEEFYFIDKLIGFKPFQNTKYSWINSLGDFGVSLMVHIITSFLLIVAIFIAYDFISCKYKVYKLTFTLFAFLFAGAICSLIDKVFWGGSLDYILLENLFIFDLKDVYLTIFEVILVMLVVFNYKGFRDMSGKAIRKDFHDYIKKRFWAKEKP